MTTAMVAETKFDLDCAKEYEQRSRIALADYLECSTISPAMKPRSISSYEIVRLRSASNRTPP